MRFGGVTRPTAAKRVLWSVILRLMLLLLLFPSAVLAAASKLARLALLCEEYGSWLNWGASKANRTFYQTFSRGLQFCAVPIQVSRKPSTSSFSTLPLHLHSTYLPYLSLLAPSPHTGRFSAFSFSTTRRNAVVTLSFPLESVCLSLLSSHIFRWVSLKSFQPQTADHQKDQRCSSLNHPRTSTIFHYLRDIIDLPFAQCQRANLEKARLRNPERDFARISAKQRHWMVRVS